MHVGDVVGVDGKHEGDIEGEEGSSEVVHGGDGRSCFAGCVLGSDGAEEGVEGKCGEDDAFVEAW